MHRSGESVAAIATALAKAQIELSNPEKASVGSVYNTPSESTQSFRYASLSSGLDIIRKVLGSHQIAVTQTTGIDRPSGAINLTTALIHSSGEWIASDWPVCALSEISQPRRMGAALTYARRYALFTMVGIAGEDDLDATHVVTHQPKQDQKIKVSLAAEQNKVVAAANPRSSSAPNSKLSQRLSVQDSATIKDQLIQQIQTLPNSNLLQNAFAILKIKNRLLATDAKKVEEAFSVKSQQDVSSGGEVVDPVAPEDERTEIPSIPVFPEVVTSPLTAEYPKDPDENSKSETGPFKIQKSELTISEPRRRRDKAHLKFVASHPCLVCGKSPADAHHLRFTQPRALGRKVSDEFTVPLCRAHHRENHRFGDEVVWWQKFEINPLSVSFALWSLSQQVE